MTDQIMTPKAVCYVLHEEGIVPEAYKDSVGVWTWAGGVTNASGHEVFPRYLDKPQSMEKCLEITIWLMRNKYMPSVNRAFEGVILNEAQVAAAISFQWNTGAIRTAQWVRDYMARNLVASKKDIMDWSSHGQLTTRRTRERDLFFGGKWPPLLVPVWGVAKPSYHPHGVKSVDLLDTVTKVMGGKVS